MISIATFQSAPEFHLENEWCSWLSKPRAVLLIGSVEQTSPLVASLLPCWPAPIEICRAETFTPDMAVRTLVLQDACEMSRARQASLLEWLNETADTRAIVTARRPLFPGVVSGQFSSALYYRLNTIMIDFTDSRRHDRPC
jgi:Sigma-54 interaction domain